MQKIISNCTMKFAICAIAFIIVSFCGLAKASTQRTSLKYKITKTDTGLKLEIQTESLKHGGWLGVSLYKSINSSPVDFTYPVKLGYGITVVNIEPSIAGGIFEIALWGMRISKEFCMPADKLCQKAGYKLIDMQNYAFGSLRLK